MSDREGTAAALSRPMPADRDHPRRHAGRGRGDGEAIFEGGIRIVEVPLNSPDPLESIERLAKRFGEPMLVGAGTVLSRADVGE